MNKKKFPKAVLRTADEMRGVGADRTQDSAPPTPDNVIEMVPKAEASSAPNPSTVPESAPAPVDPAARLRNRKAIAIVERYANLSAVGGAIPMPIANAAAVTAILVRMVKSLSELYDVPFQRNRARAIVIGLMGGVLPTGFATIATSTLTYFIPGYNILGLAVSSVTSSAYARNIGRLFIDNFENGSTLVDFRSVIVR